MCKNLILQIILFIFLHVSLYQGTTVTALTNCTDNGLSCIKSCNEPAGLPYTSTFCDSASGACICDCRDTPSSACTRDPDSDCNILCENKNPNPDLFTYIGSFCPSADVIVDNRNEADLVCVCSCSINPDYVETNEI